jgi:hypothetical protein
LTKTDKEMEKKVRKETRKKTEIVFILTVAHKGVFVVTMIIDLMEHRRTFENKIDYII